MSGQSGGLAAGFNLRVHQYHALRPGPALIVLGRVHGNEVAGSFACRSSRWLSAWRRLRHP
ncbi:MAG: hypothetical protein FJY25_21195 [Betaproteobacteria bacterium]|nr:hypothetical protein [Betaproteobacteria bacterium]